MMELLSGGVVGILGSAHCAGMCGPLALALPVPPTSRVHFLAGRLLYNVGRVVTYAGLGALAGVVGRGLFVAGTQQVVSIVLGVLLLTGALAPVVARRFFPSAGLLTRIAGPVQLSLVTMMQRSSLVALFVLGLLNGLLPCGLVYVALAAAVTTGDPGAAVLFMVGFGIGTVPVMFVIAVLGRQLQGGLRRTLSRLMPVFAVVIAVLIILRGLNLGIPYISPKVSGEQMQQRSCH